MMVDQYRAGDPVVYRMEKTTTHPGPRAQQVEAAPRGEFYSYHVDKYWIVAEVHDDGRLLLKTRRGKDHLISKNDRRLRHARWWEKFFLRDRFPHLESLPATQQG